ncbi:MAG: CHASE3 domain-containing protein [Alphaproteobacteria bacterium]|nr:CHASE3 domain-containing protein [Alphaproteobacteria bacterium]
MQATTILKARHPLLARLGALRGPRLQFLVVNGVFTVAALILMSFTLSSLSNSRREAETTEDTMLEVTTVETRMLDYEGAQYGYVLSGSTAFRDRIDADHRELTAAMAKLRYSVRNDPPQLKKFDTIVPLMHKRNALYAMLAKPEYRGEIGNSPAARYAKKISDDIRGNLWRILKAERAKRYLNSTGMITEAERSYWIAAGIVALAFLFGAFCLALPMDVKTAENGRSGDAT